MISILQKASVSIIAVFLALLIVSFANAQESVSFTVSPTIFDMSANPGQTWNSSIRIINANPYDLTVYMNVVNFKPQGESGAPQFIAPPEDFDVNANFSAWIKTDAEVLLPAEKTIELPIQITVPKEAEPGGHFAAVLIGTKPPENKDGQTKVETSQIISTLLFLRVSGDVQELASIRSFRTLDYILNKPEATFELRIQNSGNVHVQPQGDIKIFNMWGQERGIIPVNRQALFGNVLSQSVRKYDFDWKGEWSISDIGRYTAEVTLSYGANGKQSMTSKTAFWVIPWKILLLVILVLFSFGYLFTWGIKMYIRRMLLMAGVSSYELERRNPVKSRRKVSVTAPLEAGMLDLRTRLEHTDSFKKSFTEIVSFIKLYWKFFAIAVAAIIFVGGLFWYFSSALTPTREYEVITDGGVKVTSEEIEQNKQPMRAGDVREQVVPSKEAVVNIVNRSGFSELTKKVEDLLTAENISITGNIEELDLSEDRTVIVYSPSQATLALELSSILGNAPLSALSAENDSPAPEITIYIGSDMLSE